MFIERQKKLMDICGEILDRLSSRRWSASVRSCIAGEAQNCRSFKKTQLLFWTNTEDVQGEDFDDFVKWLVRSAPKAQLMITTREDVGFVSADVHKVNLDPLDAESSAELLHKLVTNCSEEHVKELGQRCGGMPLFLIKLCVSAELWFQPRGLNPRT
ncbi:hypothetical protein OS493_027990 [Desmophyllum pertusum]|uniref:NB-ARC domain-containing protein n=1 Tax=Desmophyllum pertusum TaxID=174260 RepID=A0A9W9Y987_9CNID|nr:hypothetical protein OS493_027990 [Desmophyllum pertusum]